MINAPTIVRLIRFPKTYRLEKKGNKFFGPHKRSGPVILSDHHEAVECTFRLTDPGLSFATGGNTVMGVEAFNEGEQRDLLLPWALVSDGKLRPAMIVMEIDVNYEGSAEKHTATMPLVLTYGVRRRVIGAVAAGAAAAAVAVAAAAKRGRNTKKASSKKASSKKKPAAATKKGGAKPRPATKKASTKKAPAKKAGGTRRGSAASRSAPRKDGRGSSAGRKSAARRSTRKSR